MATAELKAKLSLDKSVFDRGIASAQAGATRLASGLTSIASVGAKGMLIAGAAAAGLATALAMGTKRAFDFGGGLADMSAITGRSVKEILLLRRGLQDAGVSMEKVDRYIMTGKDKGDIIKRAIANMTSKDWADAAASVGNQANILDRSAAVFDRVSDLLGRSGDKMQGFFVGVAERVAGSLLPILEKFDKTDFSGLGQRLGDALTKGAQTLVGLFNNPQLLFGTMEAYFRAAALGMGNVLIAAFETSLTFFKDGMLSMLTAIGSAIIATLIEAFETPISYLQAGIEAAMARVPKALGGTDEAAMAKEQAGTVQKLLDTRITTQNKLAQDSWNGVSGAAEKYAEHLKQTAKLEAELKTLQKMERGELPTVSERAARIRSEGVRVGFDNGGEGMDSAGWRERAREQANEGISGAGRAAGAFQVRDVLGAGDAMATARQFTNAAAAQGRMVMPGMTGGIPAASAGVSRMASVHRIGSASNGTGSALGFGTGAGSALGFGSATGGMDRAYKSGGYGETYTNKAAGEKAAAARAAANPELTTIAKSATNIEKKIDDMINGQE